MQASRNVIDLSDLDDHQSCDQNMQSRKTMVKLGADFQAFRKEPIQEHAEMQTMVAQSDNTHDPRQTRELDADDFFSLGKYTI